jgi:hypothetical protein
MDEVYARIKATVLLIDSTIEDTDLLDYIIEDTVSRALVYMSRETLIEKFEQDLEDEAEDITYPLPLILEKPIARTVVQNLKTFNSNISTVNGGIQRIKDNGQEISYFQELQSYMTSVSETELFSGIMHLLQQYRLLKSFTDDNLSNL